MVILSRIQKYGFAQKAIEEAKASQEDQRTAQGLRLVGKLKESVRQYSQEPYFSLKKKTQPKKVNRFLALFRNTTTFNLPADGKTSPTATPKYSDSSQARKQRMPDFKLLSPRPRPSSVTDAKT